MSEVYLEHSCIISSVNFLCTADHTELHEQCTDVACTLLLLCGEKSKMKWHDTVPFTLCKAISLKCISCANNVVFLCTTYTLLSCRA